MINRVTHAHLGPIWYHSEPSDVPYSPNQFLALHFFCCFLQLLNKNDGFKYFQLKNGNNTRKRFESRQSGLLIKYFSRNNYLGKYVLTPWYFPDKIFSKCHAMFSVFSNATKKSYTHMKMAWFSYLN